MGPPSLPALGLAAPAATGLTGPAAVGAISPDHGRLYWSEGIMSDRPVGQTTTFYTASVSKQLIAALVARAVLDDRIHLRDSIRTHMPELPAWTTPIAVHHLIHHTGNLPQPHQLADALGYPDDAAGWARLDNQAVLTALHRVAPATVAPGRVFSYDNTGYILLAELLRTVHGRDIADLARSEIFEPLILTDSCLGGPAPVTRRNHPAPPATIGDGGLWTCVEDLLTWMEGMNEDRLGSDLTTLVQSPGRLADGTVLDYAWGIGARPGPFGTIYLHGGEWPGWCAMTLRCPTAATAVVILAATDNMVTVSAAAHQLHRHLMASFVRPAK